MPFGPFGVEMPLPLAQVSQGDFDAFFATSHAGNWTDERPLTDAHGNPAGTVKDFIRADGQMLAKVLYHVEGRDDEYFIVQ